MKEYIVSLLFGLAAVMVSTAQARGSDVALVNLLSGDVTYAPQTGSPRKLESL